MTEPSQVGRHVEEGTHEGPRHRGGHDVQRDNTDGRSRRLQASRATARPQPPVLARTLIGTNRKKAACGGSACRWARPATKTAPCLNAAMGTGPPPCAQPTPDGP